MSSDPYFGAPAHLRQARCDSIQAAYRAEQERPSIRREPQPRPSIRRDPPPLPKALVPTDDVRTINVPVFGPGGAVVLVLSITVGGRRSLTADLSWTVERLKSAASAVTKALEGSAG